MLEASPVRAFSDNYIWLVHSPVDRRQVVVVDPGDARPVQEHLDRHGLKLRAVLVTHHHPDHVGGVGMLSERHRVQVLGPAREPLPCAAQPLHEGERVSLMDLGLEFDVLDVPGHTRGHIAFVGHGAVFCGDTLFSAGCGRLFEGTAEQMYESLGKLSSLPDATLVYCAHEYTLSNLRFARAVEPDNPDVASAFAATTDLRARDEVSLPSHIGREKQINPFLRSSEPSVRASAAEQAGRELADPVEVFATVRAWKDRFRQGA